MTANTGHNREPRSLPTSHVSDLTSKPTSGNWGLLPPLEEVVEACQVFIKSYFQLGFLPKTHFFERLRKDKESISVFLLLSILGISARVTPSLVKRYGTGQNAAETFLQLAGSLVLDHLYRPSLDGVQGFFLMSLAEWGKGDKHRSSIHMGIAVRMAGILRLHREEVYQLPADATPDQIVQSEVARRTFWMLENHDSLYSGYTSPTSFCLTDITTRLPCEEHEFAFGIAPRSRACLVGTASAETDRESTEAQKRSLFATLIQCHNLWGQIARRVARNEMIHQDATSPGLDTSLTESDYKRLSDRLKDFESTLPPRHQWSIWNLRGFRAEGLDLAYLSVVMVLKLSNIILRRSYAQEITDKFNIEIDDRHHNSSSQPPGDLRDTIIADLVANMVILDEQIKAFFALRSPDQGFPAFIVFCIYTCGSLANYLLQSQNLANSAMLAAARPAEILGFSIQSLKVLQDSWPMAQRWSHALSKACQPRDLIQMDGNESRSDIEKQPLNNGTTTNTDADHSQANISLGMELSGSRIRSEHSVQDLSDNNNNNNKASDTIEDTNFSLETWDDSFLGPSWTKNLDSELALYLWPGGEILNQEFQPW